MIIYKDIVTDSELISDSYKIKEIEDGALLEVATAGISVGGESINIGGNPSAEGGHDEGTDDTAEKVNDVIHSFRLQSMGRLNKKAYTKYLKDYFKTVKREMKKAGKSDEEIREFETKAAPAAKKLVRNVEDYDFYTGENGFPEEKEKGEEEEEGKEEEEKKVKEPMYVIFEHRGSNLYPHALFWKHGLKEQKA